MSWIWWRYTVAGLCALVKNSASRLALFIWEWQAYGAKLYWYHGIGFWAHTYKEVDAVLQSNQDRKAAFGCMNAPIPDLFATNILIFLSNTADPQSEWAAIRRAVHSALLSGPEYERRVREIPAQLQKTWPDADLDDMNDTSLVQRNVCKSVFYVMFGIWIDDDQATILTGWRTNASAFILPRLVQRIACNCLIKKVQTLRENTVGIIEDLDLKGVFYAMNKALPEKYRRDPVVKLCDEIMYVIGFAGMGGTSAAVESCGAFLQAKKPTESAASMIDFGNYQTSAEMVAAYKAQPKNYIKEVCRLDPPVTSATHAIKEEQTVELAGRSFTFPKGTLSQYVVSMANRDEEVFEDSSVFEPTRPNLGSTFTWNGAFGDGDPRADEQKYPRICPGRYLALDVTKAILDHVTSG
jgi:cytochrome P450